MPTSTSLWGNQRIPIIMVSGAVNSGKSLFGVTIDENCRLPSSEVEPTTIAFDQEGSLDSYAGGLNFEHKDTRAAIDAGVHNRVVTPESNDPRWLRILKEKADCGNSPSASLFRAWYLSMLSIPPGRYRVGIVDTFTPLQEGLIDWLRRHPEAFGRSAAEYTKAASMFLWPDVKSMLSHILSTDCRLRFETFVMTVHLKNEWADGKKTKNKIAEGLDVLEKLATLHIELDRSPKAKGKEAPKVPAGILKKERLVVFGKTAADDRPVLPPRIPECTPDAIRAYIANPPDFSKLAAAERLPEPAKLSEDERLAVQQQIAQFQAEAEQSKLSALELAKQAAAAGNADTRSQPPATAPPAEDPQPALASDREQQEIMGLLRELFETGAHACEWFSAQTNVNSPAQLPASEAEDVLSKLLKMKHDKDMAAMPVLPPAEKEPALPTNGRATQEQRDRIRDLSMKLYSQGAMAENAKFLQSLGYNSANSLSFQQAADRIAALEGMLNPAAQTVKEDEIPF